MRLTKDVVTTLCREISLASGHSVSLREGETEGYAVLVNNVAVFSGGLRDCNNFLDGAACFLNCGFCTTAEATRTFKPLGNVKVANRLRSFDRFYIKAQKRAVDTYFSQMYNVYYITVVNVTVTCVTFLCNVRGITPSGVPDSSVNITTGEVAVKIAASDTMDSMYMKILKAVDEVVFKSMIGGVDKRCTHDALLWITPERRKALGWTNSKLDTVDVAYKAGII